MRRVYEIVPLVEVDGMLECADDGIVVLTYNKKYIDEIAKIIKGKYIKASISEFDVTEGVWETEGDGYMVLVYRDKSIAQYEV